MPQFAIMRFAKHKGGAQGRLEAHHERKKEKYASNPDIRTDRSKHNLHLVRPALSYRQEIDSRIAAAGCKTRKDSVRFIDTMITASPEFFKGKKREEVRAYFDRAIDFLSRKIGRDNIFAAVVHLDEKTPHLHLCFTPITKDGRLSAKEIIGNKAALVKWQDDFFKHMVKSYPDLERGEAASVTGRRHVPTRVFKEAVHLTRQAGLIARVVVYKLDRISRSILDFANMMALFQKHGVEFISSTEKFDTSTPMGRAMLNICIVFAQLERETICRRVADAYQSRVRKGFRMGKTPYGYKTESFVIQGISTKRLTADPETAPNVRLMFEMYSQPNVSLGDIARYFSEQGIQFNGKFIFKTNVAEMLMNPVYAQAGIEIYEFFRDNGAEIEGDVSDFTGVTGCCLYRNKECQRDTSRYGLSDKVLVPSPHEGIIPSELWLKVRRKLMANKKYQAARKPTQTWLAGKIKCGRCGYALMSVRTNFGTQYFRCSKRAQNKTCDGCGSIRTGEIEQLIYGDMVEKLGDFNSLTGRNSAANNPKLTAAKVELAQVEAEIAKLVDSLTGADETLIQFANRKAEELESRRQSVMLKIAGLTAVELPAERITEINSRLADWDNTDFDDKRQVVDSVISVIRATSDSIEIEWKI